MDNNPCNRIETGHAYQYEQTGFLVLSHLRFFKAQYLIKTKVRRFGGVSIFSGNQIKILNIL